MNFEGPSVISIKKVNRAGFFGLASYAKSTTVLGCELSSTGAYNTGLTSEDESFYEKELNLKLGELGKHSKWWGEVFNTEHNFRFKNSKSNELILDNPINQIKYKVLVASSKIANSELEKTKSGVLFYIDNKEAKEKAELEQFNFEFEGMKLITKATPEDKRGFLRLFGKTGLDIMTEDSLSSQLYLELKKDPKKFFDIMTDKDLKTKAFIKELEEYKLIKRTGNYYFHGDDRIAASTEDAVVYFEDIKNQPVKLILETRLAKARKGK